MKTLHPVDPGTHKTQEVSIMKNTTFSKEQVNAAIWTVLRTQYKKEAKEAFDIVKAAGYEYEKLNGAFTVRNPETRKRISLQTGGYSWRDNEYVQITYGYYMCQVTKFTGVDRYKNAKEKFDYVNCLNTPINDVYWTEVKSSTYDSSTAVAKYDRIQSCKRRIKWREEDIEKIQKQLIELQEKLVRLGAEKMAAEQNLRAVRKELGLA